MRERKRRGQDPKERAERPGTEENPKRPKTKGKEEAGRGEERRRTKKRRENKGRKRKHDRRHQKDPEEQERGTEVKRSMRWCRLWANRVECGENEYPSHTVPNNAIGVNHGCRGSVSGGYGIG